MLSVAGDDHLGGSDFDVSRLGGWDNAVDGMAKRPGSSWGSLVGSWLVNFDVKLIQRWSC